MIYLYSGTPGSGKSYHVARMLFNGLRHKKNYICNFEIDLDNVSLSRLGYRLHRLGVPHKYLGHKKLGHFEYIDTMSLSPQFLLEYAKKNHNLKKEGQTAVVIDECQLIFNSRDWNAKNRMEWIKFFSCHRHYGFDVVLITQSDRLLDRQIRAFVEFDKKHRKVNNYRIFGAILGFLCGGCLFYCLDMWYGMKERVGGEFIRYNKRIGSLYDTYLKFDEVENIADSK